MTNVALMLRFTLPSVLALALALASCGGATTSDVVSIPDSLDGGPIKGLTSAQVYATAENTDKRLSFEGELAFDTARQPLETEVAIFVNPNQKFQTFLGIGGAITDASAEVFSQMSPAKQEALLKAYYGEEGIGYTLSLIHI